MSRSWSGYFNEIVSLATIDPYCGVYHGVCAMPDGRRVESRMIVEKDCFITLTGGDRLSLSYDRDIIYKKVQRDERSIPGYDEIAVFTQQGLSDFELFFSQARSRPQYVRSTRRVDKEVNDHRKSRTNGN